MGRIGSRTEGWGRWEGNHAGTRLSQGENVGGLICVTRLKRVRGTKQTGRSPDVRTRVCFC